MRGISITGRKRKGDVYETPTWATEALFKKEKFIGNVWECASGYGAMSKIIKKYNKCISTDITDGVDFLKHSPNFKVDNIITNPPYSLANKFILTAKLWAEKKIAMILRLSFLESTGRYRMFKDDEFPLRTIYVFCKRVQMYPYGMKKPKNSGTIAYAWYIWDKDYKGKPIIDWIN